LLCRDNKDVLHHIETTKTPFLYASADLLAILNCVTSQKTKLAIIEHLAPRLVDPKKHQPELLEIFRFVNEKEKVESLLKARSQTISASVFRRDDGVQSTASTDSNPDEVTVEPTSTSPRSGKGNTGAGRGSGIKGISNRSAGRGQGASHSIDTSDEAVGRGKKSNKSPNNTADLASNLLSPSSEAVTTTDRLATASFDSFGSASADVNDTASSFTSPVSSTGSPTSSIATPISAGIKSSPSTAERTTSAAVASKDANGIDRSASRSVDNLDSKDAPASAVTPPTEQTSPKASSGKKLKSVKRKERRKTFTQRKPVGGESGSPKHEVTTTPESVESLPSPSALSGIGTIAEEEEEEPEAPVKIISAGDKKGALGKLFASHDNDDDEKNDSLVESADASSPDTAVSPVNSIADVKPAESPALDVQAESSDSQLPAECLANSIAEASPVDVPVLDLQVASIDSQLPVENKVSSRSDTSDSGVNVVSATSSQDETVPPSPSISSKQLKQAQWLDVVKRSSRDSLSSQDNTSPKTTSRSNSGGDLAALAQSAGALVSDIEEALKDKDQADTTKSVVPGLKLEGASSTSVRDLKLRIETVVEEQALSARSSGKGPDSVTRSNSLSRQPSVQDVLAVKDKVDKKGISSLTREEVWIYTGKSPLTRTASASTMATPKSLNRQGSISSMPGGKFGNGSPSKSPVQEQSERDEAEKLKQAELAAAKQKQEEEERLRLEAEERERARIAAEEERARLEAEERERARLEAEERERVRIAAEEEQARAEAEERARIAAEDRLRLEAEQREQARIAAEEERARLEAEERERARIAAEEERARLKAEERERARIAAEEERLRLEAERRRLEEVAEAEAERLRLLGEAEERERLRLEAEAAHALLVQSLTESVVQVFAEVEDERGEQEFCEKLEAARIRELGRFQQLQLDRSQVAGQLAVQEDISKALQATREEQGTMREGLAGNYNSLKVQKIEQTEVLDADLIAQLESLKQVQAREVSTMSASQQAEVDRLKSFLDEKNRVHQEIPECKEAIVNLQNQETAIINEIPSLEAVIVAEQKTLAALAQQQAIDLQHFDEESDIQFRLKAKSCQIELSKAQTKASQLHSALVAQEHVSRDLQVKTTQLQDARDKDEAELQRTLHERLSVEHDEQRRLRALMDEKRKAIAASKQAADRYRYEVNDHLTCAVGLAKEADSGLVAMGEISKLRSKFGNSVESLQADIEVVKRKIRDADAQIKQITTVEQPAARDRVQNQRTKVSAWTQLLNQLQEECVAKMTTLIALNATV
jgi:hypothetical protein